MHQLINHDVTTAFATIALDPFLDFNRQSQIFGLLQRFTVVLYSKGSTLEHVDELAFFVVITNSWKICHLQPTHYFNMHARPCSISSALAFGQLVIEHDNKYLQLHNRDGNGMRVLEASIKLSICNCKQFVTRTICNCILWM